jgi:hypothetical protein
VAAQLNASRASTVKEAVIACVGVPEMMPLELSERPAGSVPLITLHTYGALPPTAVNGAE